jgi:hypothetical protein
MHIKNPLLAIAILFYFSTSLLFCESSVPVDVNELIKNSSQVDVNVALPAILSLAETGEIKYHKLIFERVRKISGSNSTSQEDSLILLFSFFREASHFKNIDSFFLYCIKDNDYTSDPNRLDALLSGIRLSPFCHNDEWIAQMETLSQKGELYAESSIDTLLAFRTINAERTAFSILGKMVSTKEQCKSIVRSFSRYRSSPEIIEGFRSIIRNSDPKIDLFQTVLAVNLDIWNSQWSMAMVDASHAPSRSEYTVEGLKELILLENDIISAGLPEETINGVSTCRQNDLALLENLIAKNLSEEFNLNGWKIQIILNHP